MRVKKDPVAEGDALDFVRPFQGRMGALLAGRIL
jgi:hypothetical protein